MTGLLILLLGCVDPPAPLQGEQRAPTTAAPAASPTSAPAAAPTVWTPTTLSGLQPVAPARRATLAPPLPSTPEIEAALARLVPVVTREDGDPHNPWALAHGLLALGPEFQATDGRLAIDAILDAAEPVAAAPSLFRFVREQAGAPVEPHASLILKNLSEIGVAPDRPVTVRGRSTTLADLYRGTLATTWLVAARNHTSFSSPDDTPWALQGIAAWAPPEGLSWTAIDGTTTSLRDLTLFGVAVLVRETRFLADAARAGQPFERQGQGIFRYTCGGAHLLQGAAYAVARGYSDEKGKLALTEQAALHRYRFPIELAIIDRALADHPESRLKLLSQRLKFTGHWLESMTRLVLFGFAADDAATRADLARGAAELARSAELLAQEGAWDQLPKIRAADGQLYLDLVGDAAHAVRGLRLARGLDALAY